MTARARTTSPSILWSGIAAAVALLAAFAIPALPPPPEAPAADLTEFLGERRGRLLWSSVLIALGGVLYVWFLCAVAFGAAAGRRCSAADAASVAAGAAGAAILVAGGALQSALVLQSAHAGEELVRFGFDAYNSLVTIAGAFFGAAVGALAVAAHRAGTLPPALVRAAWLVVPLQFLTLIGLARTGGPFAAGGTLALVAFWSLAAWYVAVSVYLRGPSPQAGAGG